MMSDGPTKIAVAFAGTTDWYSRFVQKMLGQPINHSLIIYRDPLWGGLFAAEVDSEGLRLLPIEIARKRFEMMEIWRCTHDLAPGLRAAKFMIGSRYDWLGTLGGMVRILWWKLTGLSSTRAIHSKDRVFCSEFVAHVLQEAGVPRAIDLVPANMSPGHLRSWLRTNPAFVNIKLEDML